MASCSQTASTSSAVQNEDQVDENKTKLELCQSLLKKRIDLSKSDPNSRDPTIIALRKEVSSQLSELICGPEGVKTLFLAIDQTSDQSFWTTSIACYSLSTIILSVPQKCVFSVMMEIRKLIQSEEWGDKLSLLLASLIEISERISQGKVASVADVVFVDFILRPFQRLWEGNCGFLLKNDSNGYWNVALDSAFWTAFCWLKHSGKMKQLKSHSRLDNLFNVCMVMNGRLCGMAEDQLKSASKFKSALMDVLSGTVGSLSDVGQEKTASFFVKNFVALSESSLPLFNLSFATKKLIEVVDDKPAPKKLTFNEVNLDVLPIDEITTNLDAYINSLIELIEATNKKDKAKLLINLWSECVQVWSTVKQDHQWSLSASKWNSPYCSDQNSSRNTEKHRFIVEYLMSALETQLDSIVEDLDSTYSLKLVQLSKNLISTSISELSDEFDRLRSLDLNTGLNEAMQTRAKTLHLAIGLCGFAIFQNDELSKEMKSVFKELVQLLQSLLQLIEQNKHLPIGDLQSVADSAQQILSISGQFLIDSNDALPTKQTPIVLRSTKKVNDLLECLQIIEADYSNEHDGSVEIAERGHAIITMEKRFRNKCQLDIESIDGGLQRIFDALADNLRHSDSYVYLATINALCELSAWHHKICLPKMMFLLRNWDIDEEEESGDEDEKQVNRWNRIRCQVQMGEALAKVVYILGDLAPSYFNELSQFFLDNAKHEDPIVSASTLSGLANLILACRGRFFSKIINELIFCCESKLKPTNDVMVRRASVHLLRSIVTSCQLGVFTELKESSSKITASLRRARSLDPDQAVRLHADLALLEIETALSEMLTESLEKNTRIVK